jgi:hypothetical protein
MPTPSAHRLAAWHEMLASRDLAQAPKFLAEDVTFRSPVYWKPMHGRQTVALVLSTVIQLFEDFQYHREWITQDENGEQWALEYSAHIGDVHLKGLDLIRWNDNGLIQEFEVMIRPLNALTLVGQEMGKRLAPYLAAAKQPAP